MTEHKDDFQTHGYCVIRRLFSSKKIDDIAKLSERLIESSNCYYEKSIIDADEEVLIRVEQFLDDDQSRKLLLSKKLMASVENLVGEPVCLFKEKINYKLPGSRSDDVHQDHQAGWGEYANTFVTVVIAIDKNTEENACLRFPDIENYIHRREVLGNMFSVLTEENVKDITFTPVDLDPGDAVIFDSFVPHFSHSNISNLKRRNVFLTFNKLCDGYVRDRYYHDKNKSYPPNSARKPGVEYKYRV